MKSLAGLLLLLMGLPALAQAPGVAQSPHNLAPAGAARSQQVCVTCHSPHAPEAVKPRWDAQAKPERKPAFAAKAADALPGQPTGASKWCLSCHDGAMAEGNIVGRGQKIATAEELTKLHGGRANGATDLRDDHPVSFLAQRKVDGGAGLDERGEVQCTSCHDPHDNSNTKFVVAANRTQLCSSCHEMGHTTVKAHQECLSCHQNHTAPSGVKLLRRETITRTCLTCHAGDAHQPQGPNVGKDLEKLAIHDTNPPMEVSKHAPADVACVDCHDPHTMKTVPSAAPMVRGNFGEQSGVSAIGTRVKPARFEYEVCFKCHGDKTEVEPRITRAVRQKNLRLAMGPTAVSYHPVEQRGRGTSVPSLRPGLTVGSLIYCTDCHSSDTGKRAGRPGASGPHGSDVDGLLLAAYDRADYSSESAVAYALCYRCHERSSILSDQSFKLHRLHVVEQKTPCSICHDPHGIPSPQGSARHNAHLINFDVRVVQKSSNGKREYNTTGLRAGNCSLTCHGIDHVAFPY